jgi:hypothetical protein
MPYTSVLLGSCKRPEDLPSLKNTLDGTLDIGTGLASVFKRSE